jgi:hypothetical protein
MKTYEYEGFDKSNKKPAVGTVQAGTGEEAILYLLQSGIYPTGLIELSTDQAKSNDHLNNLKRFRERLKAPIVQPTSERKKTSRWAGWSFLAFFGSVVGVVGLIFLLIKLFIRI